MIIVAKAGTVYGNYRYSIWKLHIQVQYMEIINGIKSIVHLIINFLAEDCWCSHRSSS